MVILDSGADISVLPMSYREVGLPIDRGTSLRDAQGGKMTNGGMRQAMIELEDEDGHLVELRESFALSIVKEPLLALGKLLRRGWKIEGEGGDVRLTHGLFSKRLQFRHNSLVVDAKIRKVGTVVNQLVEENKVRAVTMEFQGLLRSLLDVAGWHLTSDRRVPFLVTLSTKFYKDSFPQFNRVDFPYRSTVIWKSGLWELVEMAEQKQDEDEIEECEGEEVKTVSFFHQTVDDFMALGVISPGDDSPFLRPDIYKKFDLEEKKKKEGSAVVEGWFGNSLEDGVYEEEDDEEDMGEQEPIDDGDPFARQKAPLDPEISEVEVEGEAYRETSSLRELRRALKKCGLGRGKTKKEAWKMLVHHYQHFAENLSIELSRKEFQRMKADEGEEAKGQSVPRMPSKAERQVHELTHFPALVPALHRWKRPR